MATALLEQTAGSRRRRLESRLDGDGSLESTNGAHGRLTLDELITGVWEDLAVRAYTRCPVCGGAMSREPAGGHRLAGDCDDCGTRLC